jgi:Tol biopolymer transport system component
MSLRRFTAAVALSICAWLATPAQSIELQAFEHVQSSSVPTEAASPCWSADGEHLAYVEFAFHPQSISSFLLGAANFHHEFLAWLPAGITSDYDISSPTWSPDGRHIAFFFGSEYAARNGIWIVGESSGPRVFLSRPNAEGLGCNWSPAGDTVAFVERDSLWLATIETASLRLLKTGVTSRPTWSPDGRSLVVSAGNTGLVVLDIATGDFRQLTTHPTDRDPAWSPNGRWIAFSSNRARHYDLWVVPASGGEPIQLTDDEPRDGEPTWSPAGDRIAFSSPREHPDPNRLPGIWIASQLPGVLTDVSRRSWSTLKSAYW